jgi:hypothetical protein
MPASAKRRPRRPAQDSLRPGWMVNFIMFATLMAAIGACYVWLGSRKKDRADQILNLHREITLLEQQIKEKDLLIHRRLAPEELKVKAEHAGLGLKSIDVKNRLFHLPEPEVGESSKPGLPVVAENLTP